jgi:hypothetical protein
VVFRFLCHQVASKAACILDQDDADAVAFDTAKKRPSAALLGFAEQTVEVLPVDAESRRTHLINNKRRNVMTRQAYDYLLLWAASCSSLR